MRIVCAITSGLVLAAMASGCGSAADTDNGGTRIVAAFYPLAFAAERIGGDRVSVTNLTPPGAEPHDVELTARDVARIQEADLVLYLAGGFQPAVESALRQRAGERLDALSGIGVARDGDPHFWLDPMRFATVVNRIGAALGIDASTEKLAADLAQLDREYRTGLDDCARREIVTSHAAFGYLAGRYGLQQIAITGVEPEAEPSAQTLADLSRLIRRDHVTTVFFETLVSPRLAETLAREAGATTAVLNPIEGLTPEEADGGEDYFSLMRSNLAALQTALGCR